MCRDIDLIELQGVIFDYACGLDQHLLIKEPRVFEFLRCLVDGANWQVCFIHFHIYLYPLLKINIYYNQNLNC